MTGLYPSAYIGVGYKFVDSNGSKTNQDLLLESRIFARVGFKLSYNKNHSTFSFVHLHMSNGDLTTRNAGYNFQGLEYSYKL